MKTILFVYGFGGHREQSKRLLSYNTNNDKIIEITEFGVDQINKQNKCYKTLPFKTKKRIDPINITLATLYLTPLALFILIKHRPSKVITTGPIVGVIPIFLSKLLGIETIFIETWSRFYSCSSTGKILRKAVSKVLIQNEELKRIYPNSIYCGRL
ncbi:MAG: hypothetical protein CMC80_02795 [Flavobacteriaceae bacterium]|nr:hypothetical protein [Flavobacteriaceae bacterium]